MFRGLFFGCIAGLLHGATVGHSLPQWPSCPHTRHTPDPSAALGLELAAGAGRFGAGRVAHGAAVRPGSAFGAAVGPGTALGAAVGPSGADPLLAWLQARGG